MKKTNEKGYNWQWRKARLVFLYKHPLCCMCKERGRITLAEVVDHIKPHKGDMELFWDEDNWQALCKGCHDSVKARLERSGADIRVIGADGWPVD